METTTTTQVMSAKDAQIINGKAKLSVWAKVFASERKIAESIVHDRKTALELIAKATSERSTERQKVHKSITERIERNLKHFTTNKANLLLVVTLNGTGESLPIEANNEADLLPKVKQLAEKWGKIVEYRETIKGTGVKQSDILSRSSVRLDVYFKGKRQSNFASKAYHEIGQTHMPELVNTVKGLLMSHTIEDLNFQAID